MVSNQTKAFVGIAAAVFVGAGILTAREVFATPGDGDNGNGGPGEEPSCLENPLPNQRVSIDFVEPEIQGNQREWIFKTSYRNQSCELQVFSILMEGLDPDGKTISIQVRDMILEPGEAKGFEWRWLFLPDDREVGKNTFEFICLRSITNPEALSKNVIITI